MRIVRLLIDLIPVEGTPPQQGTLLLRRMNLDGPVVSEGKPVLGAPVYMEQYDPQAGFGEQRLHLWDLCTNASGKFHLEGLYPGNYRVLSTFDPDPAHRFAFDRAEAFELKQFGAETRQLTVVNR